MVLVVSSSLCFCFFFFNDTATTEIYPLSLHDAFPISASLKSSGRIRCLPSPWMATFGGSEGTRLNSSHLVISYAVFCLKKKTQEHVDTKHSKGRRGMHRVDRGAPQCRRQQAVLATDVSCVRL